MDTHLDEEEFAAEGAILKRLDALARPPEGTKHPAFSPQVTGLSLVQRSNEPYVLVYPRISSRVHSPEARIAITRSVFKQFDNANYSLGKPGPQSIATDAAPYGVAARFATMADLEATVTAMERMYGNRAQAVSNEKDDSPAAER